MIVAKENIRKLKIKRYKMSKIVKNVFTTCIKLVAATTFAAMTVGAAHSATLLGQEVDPSLIVTVGDLEWVYASPCDAIDGCSSVVLHDGFMVATDTQWNASFSTIDALYSAFVSPTLRCASTYFDVNYDHCDTGDILSGYIWNSPLATTYEQGHSGYGETFLVRGPAVAVSSDVPEPATVTLLGLGMLGFAVSRRKLAKSNNA